MISLQFDASFQRESQPQIVPQPLLEVVCFSRQPRRVQLNPSGLMLELRGPLPSGLAGTVEVGLAVCGIAARDVGRGQGAKWRWHTHSWP